MLRLLHSSHTGIDEKSGEEDINLQVQDIVSVACLILSPGKVRGIPPLSINNKPILVNTRWQNFHYSEVFS
jgi:hypothetical protein